jgi:hypothetical protein
VALQATAQQLRGALETFDAKFRNQNEWAGWENNNSHRYAILDNGRRYPMKEIIAIATGTPKEQFKGGEQAIRFVKDLGFSVEALRLPTKASVKIAIHDLLLETDPEPLAKDVAIQKLSGRFSLSGPARNSATWLSLLDQVYRELEAEKVIGVAPDSTAVLTKRIQPRFWVEKTIVEGRPDRISGAHSLGKMLWSPQRDSADGDTYRLMRYVEAGDVVVHLIDNREISGFSIAEGRAQLDLIGLSNTSWAGRPCYQIKLKDFQAINPRIEREEFLETSPYREQLEAMLETNTNLFFNRDLDLNQGAYLTEAPEKLIEVFNTIYQTKAGKLLIDLNNLPLSGLVDRKRLAAAQTLFTWIFGSEGFRSEKFLNEEVLPKEELLAKWSSVASIDKIAAAAESGTQLELCASIHKIINADNLLPWRYNEFLRKTDENGARIFVAALRELLANPAEADVTSFNRAIQPLVEASAPEGALYAASSALPSFFLWLTSPDTEFFVRRRSYDFLCGVLRAKAPPKTEKFMTTEEYQFARSVAIDIRNGLSDLQPKNMIDVQSFCWRVFSLRKIWYGGKTYNGNDDMLQDFLDRNVYAVGFERNEEAHALLVEGLQNAAKRTVIRQKLTETYDSAAAQALSNLVDLASSEASVILIKSSYYDQSRKESVLKVFAVGQTQPGRLNELSEDLGHEIPVRWVSRPNAVVPVGAFFPKVNSTLSSLSLEETLDLLSIPEKRAQVLKASATKMASASQNEQAAYTLDDFVRETGVAKPVAQGWLDRLQRKQQLVFQGPPGTGKTFIAQRLAKVLTEAEQGVVGFVQFHPSYGYEDFILGLRPAADDAGTLSFNLQNGHFLRFCDSAAASKKPYVFIIDEMNRANLSRVFGELMYLLEYRDDEVLLAGREAPFKVPSNVFLIGTMNTADRSIALVDHALRRRFSFIYLAPDYEILRKRLERDGLPAGLAETLRAINQEIGDRNYELGISFFMKDGAKLKASLEGIWKGEIESYLEEYFYDKPERAEAFRWDAMLQTGLKAWA